MFERLLHMMTGGQEKQAQKRKEIKIGERPIGPSHPPFVVAEMSGNHNQSLDRALAIVEAAARAGVAALKLQTYTADTMTLDLSEEEFVVKDPKDLWTGKTLYQLYREASTPWEWHSSIFKRCRELGIMGFSTPFDSTAVDFLETLNAPCYKIASFENTDLPLIRRAAQTGKPLIISTGMSTFSELEEAVRAAREAGCQDLILLKCTTCYPAAPETMNLRTLADMRDRFDVEVGISDHTLGIGAAVGGVALGATVIEKHFTLKRTEGGVDAAFSLEPDEMKTLVTETNNAWLAVGRVSYGPCEDEKTLLAYRRSIYAVKDIGVGETLSRDNVRSIRPGGGLSPKYFDEILGKKVKRPISRGKPVRWDCLEP